MLFKFHIISTLNKSNYHRINVSDEFESTNGRGFVGENKNYEDKEPREFSHALGVKREANRVCVTF